MLVKDGEPLSVERPVEAWKPLPRKRNLFSYFPEEKSFQDATSKSGEYEAETSLKVEPSFLEKEKLNFRLPSVVASRSFTLESDTHEGISALDVANYFLCCVDREAGDLISPLKLQKLVYYAQAWSLAIRNKPMFPEAIEAWVHGPVVYKVWDTFKRYKYNAIPSPEVLLPDFDEEQKEVLDEVWEVYGELSARRLEHLTHSEDPWIKARQGLDLGERSRVLIQLEDMRTYYASLLREKDGQAG